MEIIPVPLPSSCLGATLETAARGWLLELRVPKLRWPLVLRREQGRSAAELGAELGPARGAQEKRCRARGRAGLLAAGVHPSSKTSLTFPIPGTGAGGPGSAPWVLLLGFFVYVNWDLATAPVKGVGAALSFHPPPRSSRPWRRACFRQREPVVCLTGAEDSISCFSATTPEPPHQTGSGGKGPLEAAQPRQRAGASPARPGCAEPRPARAGVGPGPGTHRR